MFVLHVTIFWSRDYYSQCIPLFVCLFLLRNSVLCIYKRKIIKEKSEADQLETRGKGGNLGERVGSSAEREGEGLWH